MLLTIYRCDTPVVSSYVPSSSILNETIIHFHYSSLLCQNFEHVVSNKDETKTTHDV